MASSSPAIDNYDNGDVFLSFRGDTRYNFTNHLYDALCRKNIKVFIDYKIDRGDKITPALEKAIEGARVSIIIFSPDYASSPSCLHELVKIMEFRESKAQLVLPIFYQVEPSEATYQEAFDRHKAKSNGEKRHGEETIEEELNKVEKWKSAFLGALKLAGWHIKKDSDEVDFIGKITKTISEKLNNNQTNGEELMCTSIIGQTAEDIFKQVWEWLMNDNISRVGIYGMGGVGKTTIATHINDALLGASVFTHVCWVTVSKELSIFKLQNDIAKTIKLDLSIEDDERKRAAKLRKKLKIKRFILILDDVWEAIEIEEVGIPPLVSGKKLLLTSRNRKVCERMECQSIEVEPLSEQDALDLFMKESKYKINDSLEWKVIVRSIVRKCAGLPLAIVVVARRMRGVVEIRGWRNTLRELENPCEGENQEVEKKVFRSLKFSYDCLPNDMFRQCFLYCSLFPEDYEFERNDLISYWIGEGIINKLDSRQAELDKGHCMIDELLHASLLEHKSLYEGEFIKMHDVVRDMALVVIRENSKAQDGLKLHGLSEETERCIYPKSVLIMEDSMFKRGVPKLATNCCSKLTTLSLDCLFVEELPSCFFDNIQNLVVLDMRSLSNLTSLPNSIVNLRNLRVLLLRRCHSLEHIPSLVDLKNLWHLDLSLTNLKEIPKGMEGLINLRMLKMSWFRSPKAFFPSAVFLKKLSHLQIVELENVEVKADILISLEKLETLRIAFYNLESLNSYFKSGHWKRLEQYDIVYFREKGLRASIWWEGEIEHEKVLYIDELGGFGGGTGEIDMVLPDNIQKLVLEKWNGPMLDVIMNSTFNNLWQLQIKNCLRQSFFTPALAQGVLGNVESLHIGGFKNYRVKEIISVEEESVGSEINDDTTIELQNLKSLKLWRFRKLRSIYKGRISCPSLEHIQIYDCGKLERLPFCTKERNKHNPIKLEVISSGSPNEWWDSLHWDHPHAKSMYQYGGSGLFLPSDDDPMEDDDVGPTEDVDPSTSVSEPLAQLH